MKQNISFSRQSIWESLKHEIFKKWVSFAKVLVQKSRKKHFDLLCKIAKLEIEIDSEKNKKNRRGWQNQERTLQNIW